MALANDPMKRIHYPTYKSPYGPKYHYQPQIAGLSLRQLSKLGMNYAAFGGVALFAVVYYASGIPRLQRDILQKLPVIGKNFVHEIPASDNPF
ncbi:hypothetical protein DL766_010490 [Monosporascus sp. MC13-8B]|uniref:Cytochrome b-c1 complex subunit 10 n=1 Tax=Monosporascus cannonballus TaxID=155416 RepID=A0ABY0H9Z0_9PEZI|nr:hypothetical protein DL763_008189 [Monosporascus cannonballus]RYO88602.1 hypothetical protein DL762_003638 [Monosporascus cannonballus]RYP02208.1 hypothetical protein DL766_010490 [Monosporascus sp. MC13-8B]